MQKVELQLTEIPGSCTNFEWWLDKVLKALRFEDFWMDGYSGE